MATIDVSLQRKYLVEDTNLIQQLPPELSQIVLSHDPSNFLDAIAAAALIPRVANPIFVYFEDIFADICARWIINSRHDRQDDVVISAFARILPFAPYLSVFFDQYLSETSAAGGVKLQEPNIQCLKSAVSQTAWDLSQVLFAVWRLLNFDRRYRQMVQPSQVQKLFRHSSHTVRHLAIRVYCRLLSASDLRLEQLLKALVNDHVSEETLFDELDHQGKGRVVRGKERQGPLPGVFDGHHLNPDFLSFFEQQRAKEIDTLRQELRAISRDARVDNFPVQVLTPLVAQYGTTVLPRPLGVPTSSSALVLTPTTLSNLESLSRNLREPGPILLHGLPGSGKTSMVHELARELGMESSMVTLHLNEQTDAKMLIGLYSTDSAPGSFSWRPGVLTTAVKEGRWVLIEDLDRAPNEVMSTLLPLVERGELLIPSRGEKIRAPRSFRLFATVRTLKGANGQENLPTLLGRRFWHPVPIKMTPLTELRELILGSYPLLHRYVPEIIAVYYRLSNLPTQVHASAGRTVSERPVTPRDLLKWCRRLDHILESAGCRTGDEGISETIKDWMFMEAADCFSGDISNPDTKALIVGSMAKEMHVPPQRVDHFLQAHMPRLEETPREIKVGRVSLPKKVQRNRITKTKKPFANTNHAKRIMEQIAAAVQQREPLLLVGETGIGKTTVVQQLAESLGHKLVAVNLSQQSEVGDLLGGFKPVNVRTLAVPLKEEFEDLFAQTGINASRNQRYLDQLGKCLAAGKWPRVAKLWREAPKIFEKILLDLERQAVESNKPDLEAGPVAKRRKTVTKLDNLLELKPRWDNFARNLDQFDVQISGGSGNFAFSFVEGNIVKAVRNGDWVLLDEINLASPDTLESIADLLAAGPNDEPSLLLSETGEIERIKAHPGFRIFGAMNPATDIGKRDLPLALRSRFTELYVNSPDRDFKDLLIIIKSYLRGNSTKDEQAADDIARLYLRTKELAEQKRLVDGADEVPHFSLRTLTRVLTYVNDIAPTYGLRRALYEGFSMGFLTLLSKESEDLLAPEIRHHLLERGRNAKSILSQVPKHPNDGNAWVRFRNKNQDRHYWLQQGQEIPLEREGYIITPSIERNLLNLVRATSTRRFPVLIQGPTSSGKTSMVEYLAKYSGNKFVRINNHEHTDLQEYLGTYVSDANGKLQFQEGLLVQALRQGHWIVLDELNLAPTDVLEALNRLLDDNRELLITETQEVVRPHQNFMLFATQNPPGLYGGRKVLSRAFRNRFLELHFDNIPEDELETILQKRSVHTAPSDCERIVKVYKELSRLRQTNRLFENKDSFATLRDLFRWAQRGAGSSVPTLPGATPRQEIANHGFMLLAERVRNDEERDAVKKSIETVFKTQLDPLQLYDPQKSPFLSHLDSGGNDQGVIWTRAMQRLYVLVAQALENKEPVLLVGETGCGKTTVCQLLAEALGKELHILNAHQNTETGDLIGSQRPVRNRGAVLDVLQRDLTEALSTLGRIPQDTLEELLPEYRALETPDLARLPRPLIDRIAANEVKSKALFEWLDGSLVTAMRNGEYFLLDEISLADDSVLERLNSVLEPERTLLLAEKGVDNSFVEAANDFKFFATMNPGGDFGKKELSPALRNRFTEIWVPPLSADEDVLQIVSSKLRPKHQHLSPVIVQFSYWFGRQFRSTTSTAFSIRDILVWVKFINESDRLSEPAALVHGAATVFIDTLGANPSALITSDSINIESQRQTCLEKLSELVGYDVTFIYRSPVELTVSSDEMKIGDFGIALSSADHFEDDFALHAPTTKLNAMRVIRALQVQKPILLEGSPGVGKTTLVSALARASGHPLTRINLSDQTDLMDLFGTDVPVEGAETGQFAWRDAPFLRAMQNGEWVLLDEMNLASQSVLEGLNACLDHRGEVYVSELDQTFKRHPDFRLFAAQNPHHQGGGRKGLPSSFVNRFIVVYADALSEEDLIMIALHNFPNVPVDIVKQIIQFISSLDEQVVAQKSFGVQGGPWEFNLRDTLRWLNLLTADDPILGKAKVEDFLDIVIRQRFRTEADRQRINDLFANAFASAPKTHQLYHNETSSFAQVGLAVIPKNELIQPTPSPGIEEIPRLQETESVLICVKQNLPCILVGPSGSGKTALLEHAASLAGKSIVTFPMNADIDTMDLVGGFEQHDPLREVNTTLQDLSQVIQNSVLTVLPDHDSIPEVAVDLLERLERRDQASHDFEDILREIDNLLQQIPADSEISASLSKAHDVVSRSSKLKDPSFEWQNGIIVQAMQKGEWLVLDNANLCSASVLDRLNSLLEPKGSLAINEHCGPNGEPTVIKPHPDFRIFLTMDPQHGELSRAMRNRAVELHVDDKSLKQPAHARNLPPIESRLRKFEQVDRVMSASIAENPGLSRITADTMSLADRKLVSKYKGPDSQLGHRSSTGSLRDDRKPPKKAPAFGNLKSFWETKTKTSEAIDNAVEKLHTPLNAVAPKMAEAAPSHPLQDSTIVHVMSRSADGLPQWVAACSELNQDIKEAAEKLRIHGDQAYGRHTAKLSRLQRSHVSGRTVAVSKDTTVNSYKFLKGSLDAIEAFISQQIDCPDHWRERKSLLKGVMHYWWRTFHMLSQDPNEQQFDDAQFQAHVGQGSDIMSKYISDTLDPSLRELLSYLLSGLQESFVAGFKLKTGLNMEPLWAAYRPRPVSSSEMSENLGNLEQLAPRFDGLRWGSKAPVADLVRVSGTLAESYRLVREDTPGCRELVDNVTNEFAKLSARPGLDSPSVPRFAAQFEHLRQLRTLDAIPKGEPVLAKPDDVAVLSNLPTVVEMRRQSLTASSQPLHAIGYLMGAEPEPSNGDHPHHQEHPWNTRFSTGVVSKLNDATSLDLRGLQLLDSELSTLAKHSSRSSAIITSDPIEKLGNTLMTVMESVSTALGPESRDSFIAARHAIEQDHLNGHEVGSAPSISDSTVVKYDRRHLSSASLDMSDALKPLAIAMKGGPGRRSSMAQAWRRFSLSMIENYVPDKLFDPQMRPAVDLESYDEQLENLQGEMMDLQQFEELSNGQRSNLRSELLQDEIDQLGDRPPPIQTVYRSSGGENRSSLRSVHGEFNAILTTVLEPLSPAERESEMAPQELQVVRENISRIQHRLSVTSSIEYEDLRIPASNILHCLEVGLSLDEPVQAIDRINDAGPRASLKSVPFMGSHPDTNSAPPPPPEGLNLLSHASTVVAVEGADALDSSTRRDVFETIHSFYDQWCEQLEADRKAEEEKTSMYRYRGGLGEEEQKEQDEFNQLFPSYEDGDADAPVNRPKLNDARALAIQLAEAHRNIFLNPRDPKESITEFAKQALRKIAEDNDGDLSDRVLLPATLLELDEKMKEYASTGTDLSNFYTDPNLFEARRLVKLVTDVRGRFRELQQVDEIGHMEPLQDVVTACDRTLGYSQSDPLAKLITSVEILHHFVDQWNRHWATKARSAVPLYDRLTHLIVSWRRLELSTWDKLFDMEIKKCSDAADSWWFIAYQAVIAGPMAIAQVGEDLDVHAANLLQELEKYFSSAVVGQFASRLNLLRQLQKQLDLLVLDWPAMSTIRNSIHNFVGFYAHFEKVALTTIHTGREPLEKKMKEIIGMTSWKETNINALRQSAKESHRKLFKHVRKFRDVVEQPMGPIIHQGLPEESHSEELRNPQPKVQVVDQRRLSVCRQNVPGWLTEYKRLANNQKTVELMSRLGLIPAASVNAAETIVSFLLDLEESSAQLRKETPKFLTDENKSLVKHLKSRKRKLFAETLRSMRDMGFQYNLSTDALEQQNSLASVLAKLDSVTGSEDTEYYFHKILDLAPRFRAAAQKHSEELTSAEVTRSIGFLEDMLKVVVSQRSSLATAHGDLRRLADNAQKIQAIKTCADGKGVQRQVQTTNAHNVSKWIVRILEVAVELVQIHGKFGEVDHSEVSAKLQGWIDAVSPLAQKCAEHDDLPPGLSSTEYLEDEQALASVLQVINHGLGVLNEERPNLAFIFEQVQLWTPVEYCPGTVMCSIQSDASMLLDSIKTLVDSILVAIEKYNKAINKLPTSTDASGWLIKYDQHMEEAIKALHIDKTTKRLDTAVDSFIKVNLDDAAVNLVSVSLLFTVLPIVEQYRSVANQAISTYARFNNSTTRMAYNLGQNFTQLASRGFCTPQEKSDDTSGEKGELESGTGLGDGEGAEDISKDIQPDEDLSELAQEKNKESGDQEREDEKDAVDMADGDLEGEMASVDGGDEDEEKGSQSGDGDKDDDIEDEVGDVDDLDPNAVDEKMWDGKDEKEADKDQEGNKQKGQQKEDDQVAAEPMGDDQREPDPEEHADMDEEAQDDNADVEQEEAVNFDMNNQDQNVQDQETLGLPDDMEIEDQGDDSASDISDDNLDELSDVEEKDVREEEDDGPRQSEDGDEGDQMVAAGEDIKDGDDAERPEDEEANVQEDEQENDEELDEELPDEREETELPTTDDTQTNDNVAPSDVHNGGLQVEMNDAQDQPNAQDNAAQQEEGMAGERTASEDASSGNKGSVSQTRDQPQQSEMDDPSDAPIDQPFKALGDALENWHRQRREIKDAQADNATQQADQADKSEKEIGSKDFQHLQNDEMEAETQAIGTATEEETHPFDDAMAIDDEMETANSRVMPGDQDSADEVDDADKMDIADPPEPTNQQDPTQQEEPRTGVSTRLGAFNRGISPPQDGMDQEDVEEEDVEETSMQLSTTHLNQNDHALRDFDESMLQWTTFQSKTNPLSLSLTSQLRLILMPSQSTKLSGAYRTGKRLSIKRIIPYIASSYKRDKIWMRRSIPTKRAYQILLCVDDSKSMGESSSGSLALESLVMMARALTMLEVGQVGVLGFGQNVFSAHDLVQPFTSHDAGARVLQQFSFRQDHTDISRLVRETIARFRAARLQSSARGSEDLWQLALILSDGLTPSAEHDEIRRLLREAQEERIMIVFIIMDDVSPSASQPSTTTNSGQNQLMRAGERAKRDSVLDLRKVSFVKDSLGNTTGEMRMERYLDSFPFQYYLIVHQMEELPQALAGLLRTWFAEVNA